MLTLVQIKALNVARSILRKMQELARREEGEWEAGHLSEACNDAEKAILNVMLIDRHMLGNQNVTDDHLVGKEDA